MGSFLLMVKLILVPRTVWFTSKTEQWAGLPESFSDSINENICLLALSFWSRLLYNVLEPVTQCSREVIENVSSFSVFFSLIVQLILRPSVYFTEAYTYRCGYGCVHLCVCVFIYGIGSLQRIACDVDRFIYLVIWSIVSK